MNSLVIAAMMFPVFATIIPVFRMESGWGIVNTNNLWLALLSCALPQIAGNLAFAIVVLSGYIKGLPVELFTKTFFLRFPNHWAITRLLNEISGRQGTDYGLMAAAVSLIVVPLIVVYVCLQKYIIKGMTAGAIKG